MPGGSGAAGAAGGTGVAAPGFSASPPPLATLRARVLARGGRVPLPGASVAVDGQAMTEAGEDGRFVLELPPGRHRLTLQYPGHDPLETTVDLAIGRDGGERTFRLLPRQSGERYESVVLPPSEQGTRVPLRAEEMTQSPGAMGDPFRVVQSLPGVTQPVWPLALYVVRGANPGNTGFFLDGVRLPLLFHFALGPAVVHPYFVDEIDFFPGAYPARYGRYASGIVAARTRAPGVDSLRAEVDVRLLDAGGIVATPWDGGAGSVAAAGRFSYTGLLTRALSPNYYGEYWDYQVRADHTLGPGRLTLFTFGSGDGLGDKTKPDTRVRVTFHRADLRWQGRAVGGRLELGVAAGLDSTEAYLKPLVTLPIAATSRSLAPRVLTSHPLGTTADLEVGADLELQSYSPTTSRIDAAERDVFRERTAMQGGGFVAVVARPHSRVVLTPALRYEYFKEGGVSRVEDSPRLSTRVAVADRVTVTGTVGRFVQMPSLPLSVPGFDGFGLAELGVQTSSQGALGVEVGLPLDLRLDLTGFYQRFKLTDLRDQFTTDPQNEILENRDGEGYGLELMLRRPASHRLYGWLAYTLARSDRLNSLSLAKFPSDWDQRHILNVVVSYRLPRGYTVGAQFHVNTGRPYPVADNRTGRVDYTRLPAFVRLDVRADKRVIFDRWKLDLYLEVVNVTGGSEVFDIKREMDGTINKFEARLIIPSLGMRASW
jgi:hypothetical protein